MRNAARFRGAPPLNLEVQACRPEKGELQESDGIYGDSEYLPADRSGSMNLRANSQPTFFCH
jgi:hypothetical protein